MSRRRFEEVVARALDLVPEEFLPYLAGVPVVVEDEPSRAVRAAMGLPEDETLLGLFTGPALDEERAGSLEMPARITIYRYPHLDEAENMQDLEREVARTVIHEVAHRFGIGEERLEELGWG
jgi:predicted Zn-dependent protease with MMP-like domain